MSWLSQLEPRTEYADVARTAATRFPVRLRDRIIRCMCALSEFSRATRHSKPVLLALMCGTAAALAGCGSTAAVTPTTAVRSTPPAIRTPTPATPSAAPAAKWSMRQHFGITQSVALEPGSATSTPFTADARDLLVVGIATKSASASSQYGFPSRCVFAVADLFASATTHDSELWYAFRIAGGADRITIRTNDVGAPATLVASIVEFAGQSNGNGAAPLDVAQFNYGGTTALTTGASVATGQPGELVVALVDFGTDFIAQRGDAFSPQTTLTVEPRDVSKITGSPPNEGIQVAWQIAAGTGSQSYSSTLSGSAGWIALLVTFEPA